MNIKLTKSIVHDETAMAELSKLVIERERELDLGRSQSDDVKRMGAQINEIFYKYGIEYCAHNLAILGSDRYKKYKFEGIDFLLTQRQFNYAVMKLNNGIEL